MKLEKNKKSSEERRAPESSFEFEAKDKEARFEAEILIEKGEAYEETVKDEDGKILSIVIRRKDTNEMIYGYNFKKSPMPDIADDIIKERKKQLN